MVLRTSKISNKKVILKNGKQAGTIEKPVILVGKSAIEGFSIKTDTLLSKNKSILLKDIVRFTTNAVFIDTEETIQDAANTSVSLIDTTVQNSDKVSYGSISDIFFDAKTGKIAGIEYILSDQKQKKTMKINKLIQVTDGKTIVEPVMVPKKPKSANDDISPELRKRIEETIGTYATKNILLPTDEILIKQNDVLTHEALRIAYTYGLLDQALQYSSKQPVK